MKRNSALLALFFAVGLTLTACGGGGEGSQVAQNQVMANNYNTFVQNNTSAIQDTEVEIKDGYPSGIMVSDVADIFKSVASVGTEGWKIYIEQTEDGYMFYSDPVMSTVISGTGDTGGRVKYMEVTTDLSNTHEVLPDNPDRMFIRQGSLHFVVSEAMAMMLSDASVTKEEILSLLNRVVNGETVKFYGFEYSEDIYNGRNIRTCARHVGRDIETPTLEELLQEEPPFDISMFDVNMINQAILNQEGADTSPVFEIPNDIPIIEMDYDAVRRLFNIVTGEHLLSSSQSEIDSLTGTGDWQVEGSVGNSDSQGGIGVYRLYNPMTKEHLYTTDSNEAYVLAARYGWSLENEGSPVFYSVDSGIKAVYRLFNSNVPPVAGHTYSSNMDEVQNLLNMGWSIDNQGVPVFYLN